jgi:hypothetical protein
LNGEVPPVSVTVADPEHGVQLEVLEEEDVKGFVWVTVTDFVVTHACESVIVQV